MSEDTRTQMERFADELDAFVEGWFQRPYDDRLTVAEMTAALNFKAFSMMADARDKQRGNTA